MHIPPPPTHPLTLDLETTTHTYNKRKASPFSPKNYVVASGYQHGDRTPFINYFSEPEGFKHHIIPIEPSTDCLIGFNIKFDLLYMWGKREVKEFLFRGGWIWDCQYVHYLLQGMQQTSHMVAMDSIVEEYGGKLKIDEVKALWDSGVDTPDIDETLLCDYLEGDIQNTYTIFREQLKQVQEIHPHFYEMVYRRMLGLLATTEMEYNGLQIDEATGKQDRDELSNRQLRLTETLNNSLPPIPEGLTFNWNSTYHRSALLFGGTIKYREWQPKLDEYGEPTFATKIEKEMVMVKDELTGEAIPYRYKSGKKMGEIKYKNNKVYDLTKPKGKLEEVWHTFEPIAEAKDEWATLQKDAMDEPIYQTNAEVISYLSTIHDNPILTNLAEAQKIGKDLTTYYWTEDKNGNKKGMLTLVGADGRIHHKLNHTSTVTGRLSSSDPNMQNIPRGDKSLAKRMFISRFGEAGRIIEIDYSQLEVIVQGVLSRDKQLCRDIREGVDFHVKRLSAATGKDYEALKRLHLAGDESVTAERTRIKGFTFQRAYGAGPQAISAATGMSEERVRDLIRAEDELYPDVLAFDSSVKQSIDKSSYALEEKLFIPDMNMKVVRKAGEWFSPTGTRYLWKEQIAPAWMRAHGQYTSFSPTERKNWPVQGLGGEIVQTIIGLVHRYFIRRQNFFDNAFLINTVHDCILIDSHEDTVDEVIQDTVRIMEAVPRVFDYLDIDVPFPVSVEVGLNWYDMEHYECRTESKTSTS